ncbi:MAG: DUF3131 domain-containing protein, partial [Oscillospiraceae bacterium]|nr:DUF3131 domain-containing protein [Oscillospiraceae bacterium]
LAPRVLCKRGSTPFARALGGTGGFSSYDSLGSEFYQDVFGSCVFAGKGLIDLKAAHLCDVFPKERILSHDILEGGILRTAGVTAVSAADGFPKSPSAYLARLSRWVRGDVQNLAQLGNEKLPALTKWQLVDNIRRAVTPIAAMGCLLAALLPGQSTFLLILLGLLGVCFGELFSVFSSLWRSLLAFVSGHSTGPPALESLGRAGLSVVMLPQTAWVCLSSICRASWRMLVSKKGLLEWQTAAQSDRISVNFLIQIVPSLLLALPLITWGAVEERLVGLCFLIYPLLVLFSVQEDRGKSTILSAPQRDIVENHAAAAWRYFEEYANEDNNFLPPDNVQETPVFTVAQRSSPTNIGLYLLSCLGARDLELIDNAELYTRLDRAITSLERLERYRGHFLNWYDTKTLKPLYPRYVSTVDSGNFLCCAAALCEGLSEYKNAEFSGIITRLQALTDECDLGFLYNPRRRLFSIGYDIEKLEFSSSYYDLFMSEARMTAYYAVAKSIAPRKHWAALGRLLARSGGRTGALSWTGTMFEYFMPQLFLPAPSGSFTRACLAFCLAQHKKRVKRYPWGISESGFFAFDKALNYQYKAHGVQKLGLKRGLDRELVVSPYSSFLVLPYAPRDALENLGKLDKMGLCGSCGFYEAADFTPSRTGGQDYAVVRSYMAHHVGMSFLACLNALQDNILQKRFLRCSEMGGARSLLQEAVPQDAPLFKDAAQPEIPTTRERVQTDIKRYSEPKVTAPHVQVLTNGEYTAVLSDVGGGTALYGGVNVTRHSADLLGRPCGIFSRFVYGEKSLPFARFLGESNARFRCKFQRDSVVYIAQNRDLKLSCSCRVHPRAPVELRGYKIKNTGGRELRGELRIYFEPSLIQQAREDEHPAFAKLFVTDEIKGDALVFTRNPRCKEAGFSLAVGLGEDTAFSHSFERSQLVDSKGFADLVNAKPSQGRGNPDTCAFLAVPVRIPPKSSKTLNLIVSVAADKKEALRGLFKVRGEEGQTRYGGSLFLFGGAEDVLAGRILPHLFYSQGKNCPELQKAITQNKLRGRGTLWSLGISGDRPIIYLPAENPNELPPYLRIAARLNNAGIHCDLVLAWRESGDYLAPMHSALQEKIANEGLENASFIYSVNLCRLTECEQNSLKAAAVYVVSGEQEEQEKTQKLDLPFTLHKVAPILEEIPKSAKKVHGGYFYAETFSVLNKEQKRPWCWVLANPSFGTLLSEKSLGYTWAINCRENRLTPWENDPCTDNRGERLLAKIDGKVYDLLNGAAVTFSAQQAIWRGKAGDVEYCVTVSVPKKGMVKNIRLTLKCAEKKRMSAVYYTEPVLGVNRTVGRFILGKPMDDGATLWNNGGGVPGYSQLRLKGGASILVFDRTAFWAGQWHTGTLLPLGDSCAAVGRSFTVCGEEILDFSLSWSKSGNFAGYPEIPDNGEDILPNDLSALNSSPHNTEKDTIAPFLRHQVLSSRLFGRTGFHQSSGAYGFRDQLQDCCGVVWERPALLKRQILRCCAVQFIQGDVLHWWHNLPKSAGGLRGVRTRCSDDMLWLPYALAHYIQETGDESILRLEIPYLDGEPLGEHEEERYFHPCQSAIKESVYHHAQRAAQYCMGRTGERSIPLYGTGDWNDSFDEIGAKGRGESVWL